MTAARPSGTARHWMGRVNALVETYTNEARRIEGNIIASVLPSVVAFGLMNSKDASRSFLFAAAAFSVSYIVMLYLDLWEAEARQDRCKEARKLLYAGDAADDLTEIGALPAGRKDALVPLLERIEADTRTRFGIPATWKPLIALPCAAAGFVAGGM